MFHGNDYGGGYLLGAFLAFAFSFVMFRLLLSFRKSPSAGWYRGFQSSPIFQLVMWAGALPFVVPAIYLYFRRSRALRSSALIGNIRSRVFHKRECEYQERIGSNVLRYPLRSGDDARRRGFRPCRWCC